MATYYGVNYTKAFVNVPSDKVDVSAWGGRLRLNYDTYAPAGAIALNEKIYLGKLPKGAKIAEVVLAVTDLGSAGVFDVGYEYNAVGDSALVDDPDAFLASVDVNAAADTVSMSVQNNLVGFGYETLGEADIIITATTATTAAGTIKLAVYYTLD